MKYSEYLVTKARSVGWPNVCCGDSCPSELHELIESIHEVVAFNALPNDWIYETIREALLDLEDHDNDIDECNVEADIYNHELAEWLKESYASEYCDEAVTELGAKDFWQIISCGQWLAKSAVYRAVHEFLDEHKEAEI